MKLTLITAFLALNIAALSHVAQTNLVANGSFVQSQLQPRRARRLVLRWQPCRRATTHPGSTTSSAATARPAMPLRWTTSSVSPAQACAVKAVPGPRQKEESGSKRANAAPCRQTYARLGQHAVGRARYPYRAATAYRCPKRAALGGFTRRAEDTTPYLEASK
jgi:hypothetical protein